MWNTRPKSSSIGSTPVQSTTFTATMASPLWHGKAPQVISGPSTDNGTSHAAASPWNSARQAATQPSIPRNNVSSSMEHATVASQQQSEVEESLSFFNKYLSGRPATNGNSLGQTRSSSPSIPSVPSAVLPKQNRNLQMWMASRENSLQQQGATITSQRAPSPSSFGANSPAPPPQAPTFGALQSVPVESAPSTRRVNSPPTVLQQSLAAQQLAQQQPAVTMAQQQQQQQHTVVPQPLAPQPQPLFRSDDHDGNVVLMATYLKNYYGREANESQKGIETMEPDDILGLVQCFYIDLYRVVKSLRPPAEVGRFQAASPRVDAIVPIVEQPLQQQQQQIAAENVPHPQATGQPFPTFAPQQQHYSHQQPPLPQSSEVPPATLSSETRPAHQMEAAAPLQAQPQAHIHPALIGNWSQIPSTASATSQNTIQYSAQPAPVHHARGPSNHRRELSLEQQLRDVPRRVMVNNMPLRSGMPRLRAGAMMLKYCRSGPPHLRYFSVQDRTVMMESQETLMPHVVWAPSINGSPSGFLSLLQLNEVLIGPVGPNPQRFVKNSFGAVVDQNKKPVEENLCFTLIFKDRTLELCALSEEDYQVWVGTLQSVVLRNLEIRGAS